MNIYKGLFGSEFLFTRRGLVLLALLAAFPNLLGMVVLPAPFGFKFHLFQILIFLAAFIFGPFGGAVSGMFGSVYTAAALNNPWIIGGNIILGFFAGYLYRKKVPAFAAVRIPALAAVRIPAFAAVWLAFAIQLPWLWVTDIYLAGMPVVAVQGVIVALAVSNTLWAVIAGRLKAHAVRAFGLGADCAN